MNNTYFNIASDKQLHYLCQACLVGKLEVSPDQRYCPDCYEFLMNEAKNLNSRDKPKWLPRPQKVKHIGSPINEKTTKMSIQKSKPSDMLKFKPRGRPKVYKKKELPEDEIRELYVFGLGANAISTKLRKEKGIVVSRSTIQRLLSGERG